MGFLANFLFGLVDERKCDVMELQQAQEEQEQEQEQERNRELEEKLVASMMNPMIDDTPIVEPPILIQTWQPDLLDVMDSQIVFE